MVKLPCSFAVNGRPKERFEGSNIDRSFFHKVLKLVKPTFLFEFKINKDYIPCASWILPTGR